MMKPRRPRKDFILFPVLVLLACGGCPSPKGEFSRMPQILSLKERAALHNEWLGGRLQRILPEIMRRENVDMWIVICREHNEDPVYPTLVPQPNMFAWRLSMLVYYDRGDEGVECLSVNRYGSGDFRKEMAVYYKPAWEPETMNPWERLARLIRDRNPERIAVNESRDFAFGDGLTATNKMALLRVLSPEYAARIISAERLAVGWLETRSREELAFYPNIAGLNHRLIAEVFSDKVVTPGVTTIDDLVWWTRERIAELKLETWFQPIFYIVRNRSADAGDSRTIQRGDLLRCDIGITFLGLTADMQELAYVLGEDEREAPQGLRDALRLGNRLQDILTGEFKEGRTGNEILAEALGRANAEGISGRIYSHPIGVHGHAAGPRIGLPDMQGGVPGMGDYPLFPNTVYAIELNVNGVIPEWGNQEVVIALEQDAAFTAAGVSFLDGRQTSLHLIR